MHLSSHPRQQQLVVSLLHVAMPETPTKDAPSAQMLGEEMDPGATHYDHYQALLRTFIETDKSTYKNYLRMDERLFTQILECLTPRILKQDTNMRKPLEPGLLLAMTLRFLATGESFKSMCLNFRVGPNTYSLVVKETCEAIIEEYMQEVIQCPTTPEGWKAVVGGFADRWQFHHAIGALDGKHLAIQAPTNMGSLYYNYKGFHSIVLLALVDADYKFMYVDVGSNGSSSDAGIFQMTDLQRALEDDAAGLPRPEPLPGGATPILYFIVGDDQGRIYRGDRGQLPRAPRLSGPSDLKK